MTLHPTETTLDQLPLGGQARIVRVGGERLVRKRLLSMGVIAGETITRSGTAPLGDPLELTIKGYRLSLRIAEARQIVITVPDEH